MEFAASAAKHGISRDDVLHAIRNAVVAVEGEFDGEVIMAKTRTESDVEAWLDEIDTRSLTVSDGAPLRAIGQALSAIEAAEAQLEQAVGAAKAAGLSWGAIAMVLNTSKQAAHRKFGPKPAKERGD